MSPPSFVRNTLRFAHSALGDMACIFRLAAARGDLVQAVRIRRLLLQHLGAIAFIENCHAESHFPFDSVQWRASGINALDGGRIEKGPSLEGVREIRLVDARADLRLRVYVRERPPPRSAAMGHPPIFEVVRVLHDGWP